MTFRAYINIMPLDAILDPQGKATQSGLHNLGLNSVENVRIGKRIQMQVEADSKENAQKQVDEACKKLLCNAIMEQYNFELEEV